LVEIDPESLANQPPVIKLVNLLLMQAIQDRASDLHIEPFAGQVRIRYRVDGVLREIPSPPKSLQIGLISRLKVMASMNISESRTPQDGRIRLSIAGKEIDLRVASVPTVYGESIVMRVLDKSTMMIGIRQLGFQKEPLEAILKEAHKPNGMLLVTGPTGSGKTTTLYSVLNEVFDPGLKFITTEDPVEYELPGIVQVNINAKVHLTFAACLRSILRQDPDVILVGEIRDVETASIAIQAALTGHMVFSTLHTNSAAATVTRLVDMGIEPFLLTSVMRGIIGQRLIRTLCPSCKDIYIPTDEELEEFAVPREEVEDIDFYMGRGCDDCNYTGYKGRLGIFECMIITDEIRELIIQKATTDEVHALAVHQGMQTMRSDGWLKICMGMTTFEEVSRQTPRESEESARAEMESAKRSLAKIEASRREREREDADAQETDDGLPGGGGLPQLE
jgi:type II secretory ATPase GspE/PulE/Tfp pilus assembly ATPase PilB-like protein